MSQMFDCPNCGAPLDAPKNGESTLRCPFCNSSVIVPEELHPHPAPHLAVVISPAETANQEVITTASTIQFTPFDNAAAPEAVHRTPAASGCTVIGVMLAMLLVTGVITVFALTQSGGPLEGLWAKVNPTAYAHLALEFGGEGSGPGLFNDARAIAVDNISGHIYVADY